MLFDIGRSYLVSEAAVERFVEGAERSLKSQLLLAAVFLDVIPEGLVGFQF